MKLSIKLRKLKQHRKIRSKVFDYLCPICKVKYPSYKESAICCNSIPIILS